MDTLAKLEIENEINSKVEIPEYLYLCLYEYSKIPSEEQINTYLDDIIGNLTLQYDTNKNGIVSGIYIYFKSINANNFKELVNQIKYSGSYILCITYKNVFTRDHYEAYNLITNVDYKDKYSFKPVISPPRLSRSTNTIIVTENPITREKPRDYGMEDQEFENEIYSWIGMLNVNSSLRIISNMTKILEKKTQITITNNERLGAKTPHESS
tara:strand:- start:54 stop:686 length:633 start_codon:yes stop_codon:yes gene_type:complete